jgi:peptidoglycan/LPS O-acetylase OafA/YrhL
VLSGYVIGLTVSGPATRESVRKYLRRRALRIVPIAWAAVLLCVALRAAPGKTVLGNLLFLQNILPYPFGTRFPLLSNDSALWSLSCEMLYYLLFVLIWRFTPRVWVAYAATLVLALGRPLGIPPIVSFYAWGMIFWLSGLSVAWLTRTARDGRRPPWLSAIVGSLAYWTIAPFKALTLLYLPHYASPAALAPGRVDFCFGATLVVLAITNRAPLVQRKLALVALLLGVGVLPLKYAEGMYTSSDAWALGFMCLAAILWKIRPPMRPLAWLAPVGMISYALYAIQLPIADAIRDRFGFLPSGSAASYVVRLAVFAVIALSAAWLLECRMQPWIRARLRGRPGKA